MAIDDLEHENATVTVENASHASSDDEFEEGVTIAVTHSLYLAPGDTSGISLISFQLTGTDNYSLWYRSMRIALLRRNKLGIVDGSGIAYATIAQKVWTNLQERFDKVNDTRCYNLHKEIATLSQGTSSISVYYSRLMDFWDESESGIPTPDCDCVKTKEFIVHLLKQKVYQFLMGLNDSYLQAHSQILMMKPLPSVNQAYAMLMSDESQRVIAASAGILGALPNILKNSTFSAQENGTGTSTALLASTSPQEWIIDTGATNHMVSDAILLNKTFDLFSGRVREIGRERNGLYFLHRYGGKKLIAVSLAAARIKSRQSDTTIYVAMWHKRPASINDTINKCSICPCARQTRLPFPSSCIKTVAAFDLIHLDVWGPYNYANVDGNKYFPIVVDDFTRMTWLFLLKVKSYVCVVVTQLIVFIQTQFNKVVKVVRLDNGSAFVNSNCTTLLQKYSIIHQITCAYNPQQNRVAERKHRHILEVTRALRSQANIPIKAKPAVLMGFSDIQKAYIILDLSSHYFFINKDVSIRDAIFPFKDITTTSSPIFLPPHLSSSSEEQSSLLFVPARHESTNSSPLHQSTSYVIPSILPHPTQHSTGLRRSLRTRQAPIWMKDLVSQLGHKSVPYSIANYVSYDRLSPKYQAYLTAFSAI
ncbi:uncharacterized protein [Nicotiana tomentosiformis]|uniref:uncharacterized protein n=1 Tax=Nicotiana tomentosiformis TaxID=4098 RepID=UPI00388C57E5